MEERSKVGHVRGLLVVDQLEKPSQHSRGSKSRVASTGRCTMLLGMDSLQDHDVKPEFDVHCVVPLSAYLVVFAKRHGFVAATRCSDAGNAITSTPLPPTTPKKSTHTSMMHRRPLPAAR